MHTIINTPSVFTCKTPSAGWINLAQIRQLEYDEVFHSYPVAIVTWHNGEKQAFKRENATAIMQAWVEATTLLEQRCNCNSHRVKNRR
ncbi:hypothetical protein FACHB389_34795 [Nostoc calcicola FACHB-389]|nr:hypothetical protein [Nostoc calcicola FACHB-3891]OKH17315.1 hypothetical protein FACHB389_34795 [Nostoc calcicola FACHB-389]